MGSSRPRSNRLPRALLAAAWVAATTAVAVAGCGNDAIGVDACRTIESARCRRAPACGVDLTLPVRGRGDDVESCVRYYRDACLHGLASRNDPGGVGVEACVSAINSGTCDVVLHPEREAACGFLIPVPDAAAPPAPAPDAASDG